MAITESSSQQLDSKNQLVQNQATANSHLNINPEPIDFDECLKDSPKFRQVLKDNLAYVDNLENCMSRTIKQINNYIETGRDHIKSQKDFIESMKVLNGSLGVNSHQASKEVNILLNTLEEIRRLQEIVIDQSVRTIGTSLTKFIGQDLLKIKEARKSFDKISHEYDQALTKHSQPVKKQQDDSEFILIATSTAFTHTSLDLSILLTSLQSKKGYDILDSLLSFTKAYSTFFHQGSDLFEDLKPHISDMDEFLSNIQDEFETLNRSLPSKHLMVSNNELRPLCFDNKAQQVHLEGYLFKRASNAFKVWNRRWFILKDHQLLYQRRGENQPTVMEEDLRLLTVRPFDKNDSDRRYCFEVLSPHKSHILQADTEASCKTWISAIQAGINAAFHDTEHKSMPKLAISSETTSSSSWGSGFSFKALQHQATSRLTSMSNSSETKDALKGQVKDGCHGRENRLGSVGSCDESDYVDGSTIKVDEQGRSYAPLRDDDDHESVDKPELMSTCETTYPAPAADLATGSLKPPEKPQRAYMIILAKSGNDTCADCGAAQPKWASINLGITLCIECAGIHRSLGVHLSKVRSLTLDTEVWSPEIVQLMLNLGNTSVNSAYLASYRGEPPQIDADSCREERENWVKDKYLLKRFMRPPDDESLDESMADSANQTVLPAPDNDEEEPEVSPGAVTRVE